MPGRFYQETVYVGDNGHLWVEDRDVVDLVDVFGSPLYIVSEAQLRANYRAFRDAFVSRYPGRVEVLFANKALNNPAVRTIMNQEGAGGDAFGEGELYMALAAGTPPERLVLNGSNKTPAEIRMAVQAGVLINIDALDELDLIIDAAQHAGAVADIGIRIRMALPQFDDQPMATAHGYGTLTEVLAELKWGMTWDQTCNIVRRAQASPWVRLVELSHHMGRTSTDPIHHAATAQELVRWCARARSELDWTPSAIDLGGGYMVGRPEGAGPRGEDHEHPDFDDQAEVIVASLIEACHDAGLQPPTLKLEPGRGLSQNAVLIAGRVGALKDVPGERAWANVDMSTNHLPLARRGYQFLAVCANKAADPPTHEYDVVGPLCIDDVLSAGAGLPALDRGDIVAIFDAGVYAESMSLQFNGQPRPASVLVSGDAVDVITERETLRDVFGRYRVPARLLRAGTRAEGVDRDGDPSGIAVGAH